MAMAMTSRVRTPWGAVTSRWLAALLWLALPTLAQAAGPWRAQVVDAETGQPLEGVAVIGVWQRRFLDRGLVPLCADGLDQRGRNGDRRGGAIHAAAPALSAPARAAGP